MTSDALDLPAMMLSLGSIGWSPLCLLLSILHGPRTSLTFDVDPEAPAVLTTRRRHAAFPEPTVPKSQAWHLELGCSPIWLHNGLGGLRERGEGDKPQTMYICVADTLLSGLTRGQRPGGSPSTIGLATLELWSGQCVDLAESLEGPGV